MNGSSKLTSSKQFIEEEQLTAEECYRRAAKSRDELNSWPEYETSCQTVALPHISHGIRFTALLGLF